MENSGEVLDDKERREENDMKSEQYSRYYYHRRYYYDELVAAAETHLPSPGRKTHSRSRSPPSSRSARKRVEKRKRDLYPERRPVRLQQLNSRKVTRSYGRPRTYLVKVSRDYALVSGTGRNSEPHRGVS